MSEERSYTGKDSDERVMQIGLAAAEAFKNPVFQVALTLLEAQTFKKWQSLPPENNKEAQHLRVLNQAHQEFLQLLVGFKSQAEQILAERQKMNDPAVQEAHRLDEQGFGLNLGGQQQ